MKYGDWQLRDNAAYYKAQDVMMYPATNVADAGSLNTENNVRSIVRRITNKSYKLSKFDFRVSAEGDSTIKVSPGEANIQGYHLIANASLTMPLPSSENPTAWTLGISLSYDAANHVTGDVINNAKAIGENETFSGAYLYLFDSCQISHNYDNILVLARIWEHNGKFINNQWIPWYNEEGIISEDTQKFITNGIENDPVNDNVISGDKIEVSIHGAKLTAYDTLQSRDIENIKSVKSYDTMKNPVDEDVSLYTKPQTFTTDLQDFLNYIPDWYTSKYGDYMTGALRFDQLSIDGKIFLDPQYAIEYVKDSCGPDSNKRGLYHGTAGVFISPRTLGKLTDKTLDLANGGTIMSVVPRSYSKGIDYNNGEDAGYVAMTSQAIGDIGVMMHTFNNSTSRISMPTDSKKSNSYLLVENISNSQDRATMRFDKGYEYFDSYNGAGIQFSAAVADSYNRNLAIKILPYEMHGVLTTPQMHSNWQSAGTLNGFNSDTTQWILGIGTSTTGTRRNNTNNNTPYLQLGNLMLYSCPDTSKSGLQRKLPRISVYNSGATRTSANSGANTNECPVYIANSTSSPSTPYVIVRPGLYTDGLISEDYIQVGVRASLDYIGNDAIKYTKNRILIGKRAESDSGSTSGSYTFIEQTSSNITNTGSQVMNKLVPPTALHDINCYEEIGGIYSFGNIGCSNAVLPTGTGRKGINGATVPYDANHEWVRFTQYRYANDNDAQHGGTYNGSGNRKMSYGTPYNIEFNTTLANQRSNQIIWHYKGGKDGSESQPVTLSYIHDTNTVYPNETYYDYNMFVHNNPTFAVKDFLRIDGAGLSIHGDINNPALDDGQQVNGKPRLGVTLAQGRVYSSIYNDYAETYEKDDIDEAAVEGMLVMLNPETGKYRINEGYANTLVVGVISDNYGMLIGGKSIDCSKDQQDSMDQRYNFAVGVAGKLFVNVDKADIQPGELLISSSIKGLATSSSSNLIPGTIVGKALSTPVPVSNTNYYRCLMQIMLA